MLCGEQGESVLKSDDCYRESQAKFAHQFVLKSLQSNMARTLRTLSSTPTLAEVKSRVQAAMLRMNAGEDSTEDPMSVEEVAAANNEETNDGTMSMPPPASTRRGLKVNGQGAATSRGGGKQLGRGGGRGQGSSSAASSGASCAGDATPPRKAGAAAQKVPLKRLASKMNLDDDGEGASTETGTQKSSRGSQRSPRTLQQSPEERANGYLSEVRTIAESVLKGDHMSNIDTSIEFRNVFQNVLLQVCTWHMWWLYMVGSSRGFGASVQARC